VADERNRLAQRGASFLEGGMAQRYKLRLGDGTFLAVDLEGLKAWAQDGRAVVQTVGSQRWRPLQEVLFEEESAARLARALVPPQPRQPPTPLPPEPSVPAFEPPPASPAFEPPAPETPAFEPPVFGLPPTRPSVEPPSAPLPPFEPPPWDQPPTSDRPPSFDEPPAVVESRPNLQVLADDPAAARGPVSQPAARSDDGMPILRMKPLEEEEGFRSAWAEGGEAEEDELDEAEPRHDGLEGPLLTVLQAFGGVLSRLLAPLAPLVRNVRFGASEETEPGPRRVETEPRAAHKAAAAPRAPAEDVDYASELPESGPQPDATGRRSLYAHVSEWVPRASEWIRGLLARLKRPAELEPSERPGAPAPSPGPSKPQPLFPREPVQTAPPSTRELPVLRFVESREPREEADIYEGDEPTLSFSLEPVWLWAKRIVVLGALAALGVYAVLERETWFPRAASLGQKVFTEVDRQVLSRQRSEQRQRALADASGRLPWLASETILLFFARSPTGIVEPPEVFQLAREATDRGRASLTPSEAEELRALERELLATLQATERERVREYDQTRTRRPIFPFENPHVMELVARGARGLPAERRERLQALTHKAVAAGIDMPPPGGSGGVRR
jgi:hypothetical protein